ncbi:MAG: dTMP kinase [Nitrososphaerota archaeon]|jgi:dTMP kinase|uniref:dTMP kinase n=1 Tax=Candidatus Bathycorpusculum sp. TaxID=2994959 RepID=UPI00283832E8|nr:dTMP kinase [Candidatus Termiticorpusculum sp.]MCL2256879.1 dTMP kinase [Candidatus Termiticorpusculum sp.]MCL2292983.1 dTMP kinase [Candidatus Termiticorpusculum sp.]MDR0460532.1 dTMP kinase [Nitrososphaerota archaeon]
MKGIFICIEGLDGSGKSTQAKLLTKKLCKAGYNAVFTAEPSQGKIGKLVRKCLFEKERLPTTVEALLFAADRIEHVKNTVVPALTEGKIVISDRYVYSSLAYQGSAGLDLTWIETINANAKKPDLSIFIDVAPEIVLERLKRKKSVMENLQTQLHVYEIYQKYVARGELKKIDGAKSKKDVLNALYAEVVCFLKKNRV